ncbi:MAG: bifunctional 3-deoxy-7-phosphoheptulonate synthase/chorismate mutase [Mycobacterium leprae]
MSETDELRSLRDELDIVDRELVELLARRMGLVAAVGGAKARTGATVRDPERERAVLESVETAAREHGLPADLVRRVFREILGFAVDQQAAALADRSDGVLRIAFQGVEHAYSHLAAQKYVAGQGRVASYTGYRTFAEVVAALAADECDLAILPIENTTAGSINQVYDLLQGHDVAIVGEETWRVDHCLAGVANVPLSALTSVLSHPQGLEQCAAFLRALPHVEPVPFIDTADAMRAVAAAGDPSRAAIGSPQAAAAYGLVVLRRGIADHEENYTRFVVLARQPVPVDPRVPCKTSLVLVTRHEEGALLRCLEILSGSGHSMTKLESRPRPGQPFEYMFFLDFEGNVANPATQAALDELRNAALYVKVLGSYPAKVTRAEVRPGQVRAIAPAEALESVVADAPKPARSRHYRLVERAGRGEDTLVRVGDVLVGGSGFVVIAGPCSVESVEQVTAAARAVKDLGAHALRGGVFKPRTSPYAFQGLGWQGLDLLAAAGRAVGLPIVTEVMAVEQVRRMAKVADVLQVGARNMQNFDLLRELGKVDRPVLLKRGLSSTIDEWLAAAEYVLAQGNQQVILCERGIRTFESATRNTLDLSAVAVLRERTHLPVIVDPSHGTGNRRYVAPMAWAARAVGAHGLLVEVHPDPDRALSDADQSLDVPGFAALMAGLARVLAP